MIIKSQTDFIVPDLNLAGLLEFMIAYFGYVGYLGYFN